MIIRGTNYPDYLIIETQNSFTVYERVGESFVVASENSWKELSWAKSEVEAIRSIKLQKEVFQDLVDKA